jgi:RNA polymerase sigma-70 factor (ECF subfamily)
MREILYFQLHTRKRFLASPRNDNCGHSLGSGEDRRLAPLPVVNQIVVTFVSSIEAAGVSKQKVLSFEGLYEAHSPKVKRLCRLLLKNAAEAEETGQEIFLKMFKQYQSERWPDDWSAWLTRVTVNACHDRRKSAWWKWWQSADGEVRLDDHPSSEATPEQRVAGREEHGRIWGAFRSLSARQQQVFVLRYMEGWSTEQVAETLAITTGSVKNHLFRAIHALRARLGDRR